VLLWGLFLTGKSKGAMVAGIVGAAIGASLRARKEAKKLSTPILFEENGCLYREYSDGKIEFVKQLHRPQLEIPSTFSIE